MNELIKRKTGKSAHGQTSTRVGVRIPQDIMSQINALCEANQLGKSAVIVYLLSKGLENA